MKKYIYFDNAATTVSKPDAVIRSVAYAMEKCGNPGRSGHELSMLAASEIYSCRESVCRLFGYDAPERVVFTSGATHSLNSAIKGLVKDNSHVLISNMEHNSVIRPVHALASDKRRNISYSAFDATGSESETVYDFVSKLRPDTRTAVITLASNVTGKLLPVSRIANICKNKGIVLICDAAQAAGCVPVNVNSLGIDVLCFAGHKSLYGPQGVGGILFRKGIEPECIMEGGNGINSASKLMEGLLPERLEAGTMNTPGICGLNAGISYVSKIGINEIFERNSELAELLTEKLLNIPGVTLYGLSDSKTPVVLFNKKGYMSEELAAVLGEKRICVRGGFHCAPLAHAALGTGDGGAVRVSMTFSNTVNEIDAFVTVLNRI